MGVSTEALNALMQFGTNDAQNRFIGRNSNDPEDPDIKRERPDFADPARKGDERPPDDDPFLEGDALIPKAVRAAQAAIKDPVLALQPQVKPLFEGSHDMEP